ncbi:MAG: sigma-70 family RNA polymerase sigma factor [Acidobacteria bacterium]|nr:sigma-70 family RNA polymerase sigma factor [Acidobacteriota bacterium]
MTQGVAAQTARQLYEENLELVERICASAARRQGCRLDEIEDFTSHVHVKLLEDECARLARFEGRSSLKTFLVITITNLFRDWRDLRQGKWRPSALALHLGPTAVRLERLLFRDRRTFDEAVRELRAHHGETASDDEIEEIVTQLKPHFSRRFVGDDGLEELPSESQPEERVLQAESQELSAQILAALEAVIAELPLADRMLLRWRFEDGLTVARIARMLEEPQRPLYSRLGRLFRLLRKELEARGIDADQVKRLGE